MPARWLSKARVTQPTSNGPAQAVAGEILDLRERGPRSLLPGLAEDGLGDEGLHGGHTRPTLRRGTSAGTHTPYAPQRLGQGSPRHQPEM